MNSGFSMNGFQVTNNADDDRVFGSHIQDPLVEYRVILVRPWHALWTGRVEEMDNECRRPGRGTFCVPPWYFIALAPVEMGHLDEATEKS